MFLGGKATYTVEDAIDKLGYGPFQMKLMFVVGLAWVSLKVNELQRIPSEEYVSSQPHHHQLLSVEKKNKYSTHAFLHQHKILRSSVGVMFRTYILQNGV